MALGLSRAAAARFSFLLSIPVILGATVFKLPDLGTETPGTLPFGGAEIAVGVLVAAVSGYWAIRFLLRLVQTDDLLGFARYVAGFATVLLAATFWIG
jgi:undecaprenyl-diphosphatase